MTRRNLKIVGFCLSPAALAAVIGDYVVISIVLLAASAVISVAAWWPRSE